MARSPPPPVAPSCCQPPSGSRLPEVQPPSASAQSRRIRNMLHPRSLARPPKESQERRARPPTSPDWCIARGCAGLQKSGLSVEKRLLLPLAALHHRQLQRAL